MSADDAVAPVRPVSTVEDDDRQALARIANGELNALEALYDRYRAMAYSIALRVTGDASLAEDVLQERQRLIRTRLVPGDLLCLNAHPFHQ